MSMIGKPERVTQNRVIALFRDELHYRYLGDWTDRPDNNNIEEKLLTDSLTRADYSPEQISRALYLLKTEAENPNRSLYDNNAVRALSWFFWPSGFWRTSPTPAC